MTKHNVERDGGKDACSWWRSILIDPAMAGERVAVGVAGVNSLDMHLVFRIFDPRALAMVVGVQEAQNLWSVTNTALHVVEDELGRGKGLEALSECAVNGVSFGCLESFPSVDLESVLLAAARVSGMFGGSSRPQQVHRLPGHALVGHA